MWWDVRKTNSVLCNYMSFLWTYVLLAFWELRFPLLYETTATVFCKYPFMAKQLATPDLCSDFFEMWNCLRSLEGPVVTWQLSLGRGLAHLGWPRLILDLPKCQSWQQTMWQSENTGPVCDLITYFLLIASLELSILMRIIKLLPLCHSHLNTV